MFTVGVLGPVEVRRDGELLPVPTGKTSELLVRLALEAGTRVRTDVLLEDLWAEPTGRNTLQSKVSQLRRSLQDKTLVTGSGDGYALAVDPGVVDALRVVELAATSAAAREAGRAEAALELAGAGLALFRGEVLVDAADWAAPHRARLDEVRLGLLEDVMTARVDLGSGGEVVGELEALVREHPLRERLWTGLILALYRSGRQADALAAYTRVRQLLMTELGLEPGPQLRALERQVLRQSPQLGSGLGSGPARSFASTPGNLPAAEAGLVGREADLDRLATLVRESRLVSIVGPAGVGKTRLAVEVGRGLAESGGVWPGGVWLVRLEAVEAMADVAQVVADTLHVPGGAALRLRLEGAETVLVLDNCEHLVEAVGEFAVTLLDEVPRVRLLVTSQVPLGVEGERVHVVEPLSGTDSVALFTRRAQETRRDFSLDLATTALVREVCDSLDGLPLAIELAAARVRSISVRDIARRLDDRFALLQDPGSRRPERRRALAAAIGWSHDLLFTDDQRGLWALSCFSGDASLDALERVCSALGVPPGAVLDSVTRLVDRSLVTTDDVGDGHVRYRLLDSVREYAAARLREAGELPVARTAHAGWYADQAAWCATRVRTERQSECVAVVRAERANIDAALAWCAEHDRGRGLRIASGFGWTWVVLGDGTGGASRVRQAIGPQAQPRDRASALLLAGWLEASAGNVADAEADVEAAAATADALADEVLRADVARHRAFLRLQQGRAADALANAAEALTTYRVHGLDWESAAAMLLAAFGSLMRGDTVSASRDARAAVEILEPIGDSWGLVHAEAMLGGIAQAEHRFADAVQALSRAAAESRRLGFAGQAALHLATLGRARQRAGDLDGAVGSFEEGIAAAGAGGDGRLAATARLQLARLLRVQGRGDAARPLLEENRRWYDRAAGGEGALLNRCLLAAETGDAESLAAVLAEARSVDSKEVIIHALDALAVVAALRTDGGEARALLEQADALMPTVAHLLDPADRADRARAVELLRPAG